MEQVQDILIGREAEIKYLNTIISSKEAEFVVVYGRRRVGKTFLVNTYFDDKYTFKLTGLAKKGKREQLANFTASLNRYGNGKKYTKPRTWYEAFDKLRDLLETVQADGKRIIFIDLGQTPGDRKIAADQVCHVIMRIIGFVFDQHISL